MRTYELPAAWRAIEYALEDSGGEITPEIEAQITAFDEGSEMVIDCSVKSILNALGDESKIKAEIAELSKRSKTAAKTADSLKQRLQAVLVAIGKPIGEKMFNADGTHYAVLKENPPKVVVSETAKVEMFPAEFLRVVPVSYEADKKAILAAWKEDKSIPSGVHIVREQSITIK